MSFEHFCAKGVLVSLVSFHTLGGWSCTARDVRAVISF